MSGDPTDLTLFDPRRVVAINERPLQSAGHRDALIRTATLAGPDEGGDRRVFLSRELLRRCLDVAEASPVGMARLDQAGLRVDLYRAPDGHTYEVWTLLGRGPRPEPLPGALDVLGRR